ncbi:hypothetical protein MMC17_007780 [Xylographa soralifera]|nr:hypothetical protein [Xylographa soralifera]
MSLVESQQAARRLSPSLTVNLPTNNPFRKGAPSPALTTPPERPSSRNPFLDNVSEMNANTSQQKPMSPVRAAATNGRATPPRRPTGPAETGDFLNKLSLADQTTTNGNRYPIAPPRTTNGLARAENMPPPMKHRPSRSHEEEHRLRNGGKPRGTDQVLDIFADPPQEGNPRDARPRRNSDSSVVDRNGKPLDPEEIIKRRRHRARDTRARDAKGRPLPSSPARGQKPTRRLDVIDKLDVTSIYGTGLFHHDGPFDACNPHRNRKGSQRAPMQAFPKDSANNIIGGSGPVNKNINLAQFHGHGADAFSEFSTAGSSTIAFEPYAGASAPIRGDARPGVDRTSSFVPAGAEVIHSDLTLGLGTSTFLEGAPAARKAIERRESDGEYAGAGLSRKKSIAQKIRGISNGRRDGFPRTIASPEPRYERTTSPVEAQSAGGAARVGNVRETNPFFNDYDTAYEKKGASIKIAEEQDMSGDEAIGRARAPSNPIRGGSSGYPLEKKITNEARLGTTLQPDGESKTGGGFLSRVKSLRTGGRGKPRPERRETSG